LGLDTVELVLALEEEFGLQIPDDAATRLTTPGEVADYLCTRLRMHSDDPCPSQRGFYQLRKAITRRWGRARAEIRPDTPLDPLLRGGARKKWQALGEELGCALPRLRRSRLLFWGVVVGVPAQCAAWLVIPGAALTWPAMVFVMLFLTLNVATRAWGTEPPRGATTVGHLTRWITSVETGIYSREQVLARVIRVTSEQLNIPMEDIRPNSRFVQDLGAE
jgi:acyl carrier protein